MGVVFRHFFVPAGTPGLRGGRALRSQLGEEEWGLKAPGLQDPTEARIGILFQIRSPLPRQPSMSEDVTQKGFPQGKGCYWVVPRFWRVPRVHAYYDKTTLPA